MSKKESHNVNVCLIMGGKKLKFKNITHKQATKVRNLFMESTHKRGINR